MNANNKESPGPFGGMEIKRRYWFRNSQLFYIFLKAVTFIMQEQPNRLELQH